MDESGHSGDIGAAGSGEDADALDHSRVKGWAAPAAPQPHAASAFELASDVPAWLRPSTESYRIQRDQAFPTPSQFSERAVQHPFGAVSPTSVPPAVGRPATPPAPRPAPPGFVESTGGGSADPLPRNFAENPPSGDIAGLSPRARYADLPSAEYGPGRPTPTPIESSLSGARPVPLQTVDAPTPSSAPPYPYEGDLDDERRLNPPSSIGQQRAAVPLTRPGSLGGLAGQPAAEFAPEPARHALDSSGAPPGSPSRPPRGDSLTRSHSLSVTERASMLESLRPDPAARPRAPIAAETPARPEAVVSPDLSARLEASIRPHISAPQDVPVRPDGLVRPDVTGQLNGATSQPNSVAGPDRADRLTRPDELTRQKPYEPAPLVATPGYSPPAAYSGFSRPGASPDSPAPAVQIARVLPKRVPAQPDVPRVAEPPLVEPTAETPALARIATHLRRGDVRSGQEQQEGFDVQAILAAVREVAGVRDASLRATPAGAHSLRLDLAEGADPAEVSRRVARLLQERMGLDAALPGPGEPGRLGAADFASQPNLGPGGQPGSPVRGSARAAAAVPVSREQPIRAVPDPLSTPVHLLGQTTREITGETSRQIPGDRIPGETSRPIPSETSRRIPGETSRRIAGETSREISSGASHRVPGETSRRIPGETSRRIPGQIPSQGGGRPAGSPPASGRATAPVPTQPTTPGSKPTAPGSKPIAPGSKQRSLASMESTRSLVPGQPVSPTDGSRLAWASTNEDQLSTPRPLYPGEQPGPRIVIENVHVNTSGADAEVEVRLAVGSRTAAGRASGPAVDGYLLRLCATATAGAVDELLLTSAHPDGPPRCFVEHAAAIQFGASQVAVVVLLLSYGGWVEQLAGSAVVASDDRQAMVRATLAAVNRRLEALLSL